jgi:hypothetical protein
MKALCRFLASTKKCLLEFLLGVACLLLCWGFRMPGGNPPSSSLERLKYQISNPQYLLSISPPRLRVSLHTPPQPPNHKSHQPYKPHLTPTPNSLKRHPEPRQILLQPVRIIRHRPPWRWHPASRPQISNPQYLLSISPPLFSPPLSATSPPPRFASPNSQPPTPPHPHTPKP